MNKTRTLLLAARALMKDPGTRHWGYELCQQTGVESGTMYPILQRMLDAGWLRDGWEQLPTGGRRGRPPRRYYEVTSAGAAALSAVIANAAQGVTRAAAATQGERDLPGLRPVAACSRTAGDTPLPFQR